MYCYYCGKHETSMRVEDGEDVCQQCVEERYDQCPECRAWGMMQDSGYCVRCDPKMRKD